MMIPLVDTPRRLKEKHGVTVPYRKLYSKVVDGLIPAERGSNGRWLIAEEDLPAIADALGAVEPVAA